MKKIIILSSLLGLIMLSFIILPFILAEETTTEPIFDTEEYSDIFNRSGDAYEHLLDDLCGMMEIAERFKDTDYHYTESDMEEIVMRDGINGTQEMIDIFNHLLNLTKSDIEQWQEKEINVES